MSEIEKELAYEELELTKKRWRYRRYLTFCSFILICLVTYAVLFMIEEKRLNIISEFLVWLLFILASIIHGYMGLSTLEEIKLKIPKLPGSDRK